jgi:hypothetical protein
MHMRLRGWEGVHVAGWDTGPGEGARQLASYAAADVLAAPSCSPAPTGPCADELAMLPLPPALLSCCELFQQCLVTTWRSSGSGSRADHELGDQAVAAFCRQAVG